MDRLQALPVLLYGAQGTWWHLAVHLLLTFIVFRSIRPWFLRLLNRYFSII